MKEAADPPVYRASDEDLMTAYAAGDAAAFDALYARHKGALYRYFLRQLDRDAANDCFQALWTNLIRHRTRYRAAAPFVRYLFTLAHNVLMDHHRRNRWNTRVDDAEEEYADPSNEVDLPTELDRDRLRERLHALVAELPLHQREVWLLRQETELTLAEIAAITAATEEGVKSRLRYAKDKLMNGMARYAERN